MAYGRGEVVVMHTASSGKVYRRKQRNQLGTNGSPERRWSYTDGEREVSERVAAEHEGLRSVKSSSSVAFVVVVVVVVVVVIAVVYM